MRNMNETLRIVLKIRAKDCSTSVLQKTVCALKFEVFPGNLFCSLVSVGKAEILKNDC